MAVHAQIRFEGAMSASIARYSPRATRAWDVAGKVAIFIAGCTFFGLVFTSNFVKLPKWAMYGLGLTVPLVIGVVGALFKSKAKERQEEQNSREDALLMTFGRTIDPVGESRLNNDFRFRTCKLQMDSGQQPPLGNRELRKVAEKYHLDVPVPTAAQILHGVDHSAELQAKALQNKESNLNPENYQKYLANRDRLLRGGGGPLFKVSKTKVREPKFWEIYLPVEIQGMLKQWRLLCDYWNLRSVLPFKPAIELFEKLPRNLRRPALLTDSWDNNPSFYSEWSQEFCRVLSVMQQEYEKLVDDYIKGRHERLVLAYRELAKIAPDEHAPEKRIAKMRSELKSLEVDSKLESLRYLLSEISFIKEAPERLERLRVLLNSIARETNALDNEALVAALNNLDVEKIDGEILDSQMNLDMQAYAAHIKHPEFSDYHSHHKPLKALSEMLDDIEEAHKRGDDVLKRLNRFELNEMGITKRSLKRQLPSEVDSNDEACALDQKIDQVLQWKHQALQSKHQLLEKSQNSTWQTRLGKFRKDLKALEVHAKKQHIERLLSAVSLLSEERVRMTRYRSILQDLNPQLYQVLKEKKNARPFRTALESLDLEKIDFGILDRLMSKPIPGMEAYAKAVGHPRFARLNSMHWPFLIMQNMLNDIELAFKNNEPDAWNQLKQFQVRELKATNHYLNSGGKSHLKNAFSHKKLESYVEAEPFFDDAKAFAAHKRVKRAHYGRLFAYDEKIHKIQMIGLGVGFQLLTTAIMVAAIFVKHRYASMALNGSAFLLVGVNLYGESYVSGLLQKKREMLMTEHLYKNGVGLVQGKEARRVKHDCDRLGIDGESAIARAIICREEGKELSLTDRLRGKFIESKARKEAKVMVKQLTKDRKKGEKPVFDTIQAALAKNQTEVARHLAPYAENPSRARKLIQLHSKRRLNPTLCLPEFMRKIENGGTRIRKNAEKNAGMRLEEITGEAVKQFAEQIENGGTRIYTLIERNS